MDSDLVLGPACMPTNMTENHNRHQRHSIRLKGYDYSQVGAYFITIVTHGRACLFGQIVGAGLAPAQMRLNEYGQIAHDQWHQIPERYKNIELDQFVVMPNHIHAIIVIPALDTPALDEIGQPVRAGFTPAPFMGTPALDEIGQPHSGQLQSGQPRGLPLRGTMGDIVGAYKSLVANECLKMYKSKNEFMGKLWQRNYYEHIVRDDDALDRIRTYIAGNPAQWPADAENPARPTHPRGQA